jgi:hypothetical protein
VISIGVYEEPSNPAKASPVNYYYFNFFDKDNKTIRLYDSKGNPIEEDFLASEPDFSLPMTVGFEQTVIANKNIVFLTPFMTYIATNGNGNEVSFKSTKENFIVRVPSVDLTSESTKTQVGIGAYPGDCFKADSITFGN